MLELANIILAISEEIFLAKDLGFHYQISRFFIKKIYEFRACEIQLWKMLVHYFRKRVVECTI